MAYDRYTIPSTQHSVFYAYAIHANGVALGSFTKFSPSSTRAAERIREIFAPKGPTVKEIVWGGTDITVTVTHVELYKSAMFQAFGKQIYNLEDFIEPVTITELMTQPTSAGGAQRAVHYVDCVCTDYSRDVDVGTVHIVENMTFWVKTIDYDLS